MNIKLSACVLLLGCLFVCSDASAGIICQYVVHSTSNNQTYPHGLWTNGQRYGGNQAGSNYYDIKDMLFTQFDDGTAALTGTAMNSIGTVATVSLRFDEYSTSIPAGSAYKGNNGNPPADIEFYADFGAKTNLFTNTIKFSGNGVDETINIDRMVGDYGFQIGTGANDKTGEFGASAWILTDFHTSDPQRWDLNLTLTKITSGGFRSVPEPGAAAIWSIMLLGLIKARRRRRGE